MGMAVLNLNDVERIIREEAGAQGGYVHELISDEQRLYARTINEPILEVVPKDTVQSGFAVRVDRTDVWVRPYVFRQVCWNGAIVATSAEAEEFDLAVIGSIEHQERHLRELVTAAGNAKAFHREVQRLTDLQTRPVDRAMMLMTMMQTHNKYVTDAELLDVLDQFETEEPTAWGVMNAVTAVARRTENPERKWRLEEFGAMVPALLDLPVRSGYFELDLPKLESESSDRGELLYAGR